MPALLCWIGVVLFAMLGIGGLLVAVSNLAWAPAGVGLAAVLATRWCWVLARRLSAGPSAAGPGRRQARDEDKDDDADDSGSVGSALLGSGLSSMSSGPAHASAAPTERPSFEPLECKADTSESADESSRDGCSSNDADSGSNDSSDAGSDNSSSD